MNSGFLFLIACWMLFMLTMTHWLDFLWKGTAEHIKRKRRALLLLILLMIGLQPYYIPLFPNAAINAGVLFVLGGMFVYYFWKDQSAYRLQVLAVVLFLAVFYAVAYEVFLLDPILMYVSPLLMLPAFVGLFVALTTTNLTLQWLMLTGGLVLGEAVHKFFLLDQVDYVYVGDAEFRDQFMIALIMTTLIHLLFVICTKLFQYTRRLFRLRHTDGKQEG